MDLQCFQRHDLLLLIASLLCLWASIWLYATNSSGKMGLALFFLVLAALGLRVFMAHLDPFLWDWDERYHALVAKNFLLHPLKPTLYDRPVLPYDFTLWDKNHIWMHKQPLAMWQMALSFLFFGSSPFTARLPMVAEGTLMVLILYRVGTLCLSKKAGYLAALLFTSSYFALDFMTGGQVTDHVDYALLFYTSASLWAWVEYRQRLQWKWALLTGLFAGLAVLSKWVTGLLVFVPWGIAVLSDRDERKRLVSYLKLLAALTVGFLVFLPWQWYSLAHYPTETRYELGFNARHLFHAVDGRSENGWYYLARLGHDFGTVVPYILLFALAFAWFAIKRKDHKILLFVSLLLPYLFFSLVAATKMPAYCYVACLPMFVVLGCFASYIQGWAEELRPRFAPWSIGILLMVVSFFSLNIPGIAQAHTGCDPANIYRINKVTFADYFRALAKTVPKDYVVFGLPYEVHVEMMFATGNTCYPVNPDFGQYLRLKKQGIKMAVVQTDKTPLYLLNDPSVLKLKWPS